MKQRTSTTRPLSVEECRELLGDTDMSDGEVAAFLMDLRASLNRFLDDYFREEIDIDM